jgi:hypothetical protein
MRTDAPVADSHVPKLLVVDSGAASSGAGSPGDVGPHVWRDKDGRPVGRAYANGDVHVVELDRVGRFTFSPDSNEVRGYRQSRVPADVFEDYFSRWILPVAAQVRGLEVLHASAVLGPRGIGVFSAASEAGKSTLAYALGVRGFRIWTDDALGFTVPSERPQAVHLPFRLRLRPSSAAHFGVDAPPNGRAVAAASCSTEDERAPIAAVFLLERAADGPPVRIEDVDPLEAFPLLVEQSYHFGSEDRERKRTMLSSYLTLATAVPAFRLAMASGLANLDEVVEAVEEHLR